MTYFLTPNGYYYGYFLHFSLVLLLGFSTARIEQCYRDLACLLNNIYPLNFEKRGFSNWLCLLMRELKFSLSAITYIQINTQTIIQFYVWWKIIVNWKKIIRSILQILIDSLFWIKFVVRERLTLSIQS